MSDILVIGARGIPGVEGGAEKHAEHVFSRFAANGYDVTLLGTRRSIRCAEYRGVKLVGIPTIYVANTEKFVYHFFCFVYALFNRPKLVHLQGLNSGIFLFLYKLFGMKVVMRYGSADHEHAKWGFIGRIGFKLCERQISLADHVIVVSQKYRRELSSRYGLKAISVIPNGLDDAGLTDAARRYWTELGLDGKRYLLSVGRLTVDKGHADTVKALERLGHSNVELVIVGGPDGTNFHEHLRTMGGRNTRFLGRLDRQLLSLLYMNCSAYVSASAHEGLSNSILEAISFGSPLIVSDIAANREMSLNEVCYFRQGDVEALAEKISAALASSGNFIVDRRGFVGWDEVFEKTERVYQDLLPTLRSQNKHLSTLAVEKHAHTSTSQVPRSKPAPVISSSTSTTRPGKQ
jgi:glycosyltransferase involved in cell wall biosynthesis